MSGTNTAQNSAGGKPFVKGDPRINRKGRPKSFDALRELARVIANEPITSADGKVKMTRVELILREMSLSKDPRQRIAFIEIAYGKVPTQVDITGELKHRVNFMELVQGDSD